MPGICKLKKWSGCFRSVCMPRRWWCDGGGGPRQPTMLPLSLKKGRRPLYRGNRIFCHRLDPPAEKMRRSQNFSTLVVAFLLLVVGIGEFMTCASAFNVPMMFVFGDSFVDSGNNNHLNTTARANHQPYGINFEERRATGRWSDGRIVTDYLADYIGLSYPPCFLDSVNITRGANFGSAGSGILNITHIGGEVLTFTDQVNGFDTYVTNLNQMLGRTLSEYLVSRSIFYINIGNNDVNDYLLDHNATALPFGFRASLLYQMQTKIQQLYRAGARKMIVTSNYALGCAPMYQIYGRCNPVGLNAARYYNQGLFDLLQTLQRTLRGLVIVYANAFQVMMDVHQQPLFYGMRNVTHPCCPNFSRPQNRWCYSSDTFCQQPSGYLFWDTAHPTDAFNRIAAQRFWQGDLRYAFPMNVRTLANL
ncbi:GDSL esterase/lipase LTL1 [Selaginella moellendorffii]|uniref:GDSL esterase/lipase LTL1 n=1 Tax=Selaginella moellendorffii TaxID=88036 RepID=UPI000D1C9A2C|nr:GDSL esterase/lipase LTL1 [Selaginella moellendorffii]|eukprot:XP_024542264.1 GDSL esterase/lipase LTL1 [Selaginella moellendorffii]